MASEADGMDEVVPPTEAAQALASTAIEDAAGPAAQTEADVLNAAGDVPPASAESALPDAAIDAGVDHAQEELGDAPTAAAADVPMEEIGADDVSAGALEAVAPSSRPQEAASGLSFFRMRAMAATAAPPAPSHMPSLAVPNLASPGTVDIAAPAPAPAPAPAVATPAAPANTSAPAGGKASAKAGGASKRGGKKGSAPASGGGRANASASGAPGRKQSDAVSESAHTSAAAAAEERWVQCDECEKWRRVPVHIDLDALTSTKWACRMASWDERIASLGCAAPEDAYTDGDAALELSPLPVASSGMARQVSQASTGKKGRKAPRRDSADAMRSAPAIDTGGAGGKGKKRRREVQWVQCENPECNKWRKLPPDLSPSQLPSTAWFCNMNWWDPSRGFCDAPQEEEDASTATTTAADPGTLAALSAESSGAVAETAGAEGVQDDADGDAQVHSRAGADEEASMDAADVQRPAAITFTTSTGAKKRRRGESALLVEAAALTLQPMRSPSAATSTTPAATPLVPRPGLARQSTGSFDASQPQASVTANSAAAAARAAAIAERQAALPPAYVNGAREYHNMLLYHPAEVWADPGAAGGVVADSVRNAWEQALAAGPSLSPAQVSSLKLKYSELVHNSWRKGNRASAHTGERGLAARESHLRWCRSSMYRAPAALAAEFQVGADASPRFHVPPPRVWDLDASGWEHCFEHHPGGNTAAHALRAVRVADLRDCPQQLLTGALSYACAALDAPDVQFITMRLVRAHAMPAHVLHVLTQRVLDASRAGTVRTDVPALPLVLGMNGTLFSALHADGKSLMTSTALSPSDVLHAALQQGVQWTSSAPTLDDCYAAALADSVQLHTFETRRAQILAAFEEMKQAEEEQQDGQDPAGAEEREAQRQAQIDDALAAAQVECRIDSKTYTWTPGADATQQRVLGLAASMHVLRERSVCVLLTTIVACVAAGCAAANGAVAGVPAHVQTTLHEAFAVDTMIRSITVASMARCISRCARLLLLLQGADVDRLPIELADLLDEATMELRLQYLCELNVLRKVESGFVPSDFLSQLASCAQRASSSIVAGDADSLAAVRLTPDQIVPAVELLCLELQENRLAMHDDSDAMQPEPEAVPPVEPAASMHACLPLRVAKPWKALAHTDAITRVPAMGHLIARRTSGQWRE